MTEDVDILTIRGEVIANELCEHLHQIHNIAVRVQNVANGKGYIYCDY